jgi:CRP/FNR family transcriptional regulator
MEDYTELLYIPAERLHQFFKNDVNLCLKMLASIAKKNRQLNFQIENLTLKDVIKRVAGFLLTEYKKTDKENFEVDISRYDMASLLGTIPETLSRTLKKLQEEDVIEVAGKSFIIKNIKKLEKIAE